MGWTLFDTAIGRCGIAWGDDGVVAIHLPEAREAETRKRIARRLPGEPEPTAPPAEVRRAIDAMVALLRGEAVDLDFIALDMRNVPAFHQRVYEVARSIKPGSTLTYGEVAAQMGQPGAARSVGQALGRNPFPIVVPCHRVLAAGGKMGGFSAAGGITTKLQMLTIEGARANRQKALFDGDGKFPFDPDAAVKHLREVDPSFARTLDDVGAFAMELKSAPSIFGALAEAIVYQQLSGKAAATIFARVRALYPRPHEAPTAEQILRTSDAKLRGAGLSQAKLLALRDLAQRELTGGIPTLAEADRMDDEAIIERLTDVRGVGRWTAEMLLMFRLGRPDILPASDYGIRKGFAVAFRKRELPSVEEVLKRGQRWAPYRTVASWYLWRAAERSKG
jgi:methylated-DNA-[protein]-cysteine S-methyltransferase